MYDAVVTLIKETITSDDIGNQIETRTEREVFAQIESVSQSEYYNASTAGLNPSIKVILADELDYDDEKLLKVALYERSEKLYSVIRTYRKGNSIEITCEEKVGVT